MSGREAYEVSDKAAYDEWSIFDVCKHGCYPGEDDCTQADLPKQAYEREELDAD